MDQHDKYIYPDDKPRGQTVIGTDQSPGVAGVWVSLLQAQSIAQTLTSVNVAESGESGIGNILRDDLFHLFATMASLNPKHVPGVQFGISTVGCLPYLWRSELTRSLFPSDSRIKPRPRLETRTRTRPS